MLPTKIVNFGYTLELMKKVILFLFLLTALITSCRSSKGFTKRRYTPGHYVSLPAKRSAPNEHAPKPDASSATIQNQQPVRVPEELLASVGRQPGQTILDRHEQNGSHNPDPGQKASLKNKKPSDLAVIKSYKPLPVLKKSESGSATRAPGDNSQAGVVLAGIGLVLDVIGLVVAGATLEYFFLLFTLAGAALGIIALVFGLKGLSLYKNEKRNGNKHTTTLVFSIISTALGGGAIILGLLYSLFGLIIVSF